jgi:glyoxylase-like metal-dependent hydrolase (beta-lactamase superfamily II)
MKKKLLNKGRFLMKLRNKFCLVSLLLLLSATLIGGTFNGLPVHIKKLSDNAIRLWVGDYISSTAVCALNTDKGIVVIDTTQCPSLDKKFREIIAKKFGRKDFIYLINTHEHGDHTAGNAIYSDCEIIAHEKCAEGMKRATSDMKRVITWYKENIPKQAKELKAAEEGTDEYKKLKERLIVNKLVLKSLESGAKPVFPSKTFKDRMKLPMGNMNLELFYMGGLHTASDIFILAPEEGLLFTGDVMADIWLTDTPGCLQSFGGRSGIKRDLPLMLKNWKTLLDRKDEIKDYIPGHWNGDLTYDGFLARYNYMKTLVKEVKVAHKEGKKLKDIMIALNMKTKFPKLAGKPGFTLDFVHNANVLNLWTELTGAISASQVLAKAIKKKGLEPAIAYIKKEFNAGSGKYYFLERDFNSLGYRYINEKKYPEAIAVLKLNVEMYPKSKNVYDSLGEAYMYDGQKKLAISYYNKVLKMDPEDANAKKMLKKINGE